MENVETERLIEEFMEAGLKAFKSERSRSSEARKLDRHETIDLPPDGDEALATVGLPEKEMNLDWYRRVRTRINGQTT